MAEKIPLYKEGGGAVRGKAVSNLAQFVKGQTIDRPLADYDDEWWDDPEEEKSWGEPDNGDGQFWTTIHHRQVRVGKGCINEPGEYTQTAIVTRTDGDAEAVKVILVTGKTTEIIHYG